ncbi:hypothetical protein A2716_00945 [candidate division WWE3 bacterium RIFCSPHIGHO2_01_FULL_40_23]|uniref:Uncharacterized protein n=1 Tax=candidate division WWE3 bacterium RIFCSPLOWO2_01_FULL_41_18 TaxID=1802625 RepID=A0A1F4VF17_UNCKA|nr:MAG: hypothetical protein A2716_00945 [candidate division WWE3 bacterium RIFCSPHIGHO2_01_FULL_40_23]OGC55558.1 MAG: hypothetical protein A3A78_01215 [candidate division WWE3 bacterium RIFCSPLOWO2_01_FULL_41_18]
MSNVAETEGIKNELSTSQIEELNERLVSDLFDTFGAELTEKILGKAAGNSIETITTTDGIVLIPASGVIIMPKGMDPLEAHNILNGAVWGKVVNRMFEEDKAVRADIKLSIGLKEGASQNLVNSAEGEYEGLTIRKLEPDPKIDPDNIKDSQIAKARALVMAALGKGMRDTSDTNRPIETIRFKDKEGNEIHVEYDTKTGSPYFSDEEGKRVLLSNDDVRALYPRFYKGGPQTGATISGIQALENTPQGQEIQSSVNLEVPDDTAREKLLNFFDKNSTIVRGVFMTGEKPNALQELFHRLSLERDDEGILRRDGFVTWDESDPNNFSLMESLLYTHEPGSDLGKRTGRNFEPLVISDRLIVLRDCYLDDRGKPYIVLEKADGKWNAKRFSPDES